MERAGVDGSLYWSITWWAQNPWETAMSINPDGGFWGNGDGRLLYPPRRSKPDSPVIEPPVTSIRLEMIREGLEDREYFHLLRAELKRRNSLRDEGLKDVRRQAQQALASGNPRPTFR